MALSHWSQWDCSEAFVYLSLCRLGARCTLLFFFSPTDFVLPACENYCGRLACPEQEDSKAVREAVLGGLKEEFRVARPHPITIHLGAQPWLSTLRSCVVPLLKAASTNFCEALVLVLYLWPTQPDCILFCHLQHLLRWENIIKDHMPGIKYQRSGKHVQNNLFYVL